MPNNTNRLGLHGKEGLINYASIFADFLDQLPLALYFSRKIGQRWIIEFVSDGITRLLGYQTEDLIGRTGFVDLTIDNEFYAAIPLKSDKKTNKFSFLNTFRTIHNTPKRLIDKGVFLFNASGNLVGATGVLMDFTLEPDFDILDYIPSAVPESQTPKWSLGEIVGHSPPMKKVVERIVKIAASPGHVLIQGESGTGKELTARAIHEMSDFYGRSFIAINCGAISEHLMESEFFGYVKGAFSGATEAHKGYLDVVDQGTLFLDEVGEMPVNMQIKLLRVLDGYGYTPVGCTKVKNSNFRLVCATNRNLESLIDAGLIRHDFYHRIKQLTITLPPLRERAEDIEPLINSFIERYYNDNRLVRPDTAPAIPDSVLEKFKRYHWPGNVRELHHAVIKYLSIGEVDFPPPPVAAVDTRAKAESAVSAPPQPVPTSPRTFGEYEREVLINALNSCRWNTGKAAQMLGKSRRTIQNKIAQYGLK